MNLFYEEYPNTITVKGKEIPIITDFREYPRLMDMLKADELLMSEKVFLLSQYFLQPVSDLNAAMDELTKFVLMEGVEKAGITTENGEEVRKDVYSFSIDYPFIFSAFLSEYGINLQTVPYMHWWEFRMLFEGLPENTEIKQRIMYRSINLADIKDANERKRIERIQRSICLPDSIASDYDIGDAFW